ncbi:FtsX-like permease family protein [Cutibacterium avidum]|uniref:ABC superfamily ATP binding cassette transporter, membrane protein n=1 Tax=Cutibacterium avidum ATCC 25577 TaxID=997355 RepID=G4CYP4_9ACTN|nr:FtsX-like permease family protein [Cutibacterium avidum]EGY77292.1 ABC superfamily ATP binding cassette transporter, membrane protein [Cutibacterium avidum ATCC 25577]QRH10613.1 FtsX-like permease family protein [Cutibacterium avidum]
MTLKIAVNSVIRGASSWLSLIVASVVLMVVVTLSIGLIVAGVSAGGDAQQAYASMGGVALGFTVLTGFASFRLVVGTCVRLQRRDVALWQIVGVLPRTALLILIVEILLVTALSALLGALVSEAVWPWYAGFVATSGLPPSDGLTHPIPVVAMITGVATTAVVSLVSGLGSARQIARADVVTAVRPSETTQSSPHHSRVLFVVVTVLLIAGTVTLYLTIGHVSPVTDADDLVGVLSAYPGMGLLVCLVFAMICGPVVRGLVALIRAIGLGGTPGFLASREAAARPRLTQALVMPISLAAAAIGMMTSWIHLVTTVMAARAPGSGSVSAPPRQMALLLGGPVIVACVCASAIVLATSSHRREDNALLLVSGSTPGLVRAKTVLEALVYAAVCLVCSYTIVTVNDLAMVAALSAGPVPDVRATPPGWSACAVVGFGFTLTLILLLVVTRSGMRKDPITIVMGGR